MCEVQDNLPPDCVTFDDDDEGLSSHKRAQASAWRAGEYVSDIDFYAVDGDWRRGTFHRVSEIPANYEHQRQIARDLGLPE